MKAVQTHIQVYHLITLNPKCSLSVLLLVVHFRCGDALQKNKHLITVDQRAYQKELERNYTKLTEQLEPLLKNKFDTLRGSMRQKCSIVFSH